LSNVIGCVLQLVDVGVEDAVHKPNARALVRVLIRQLNVDLPETALEGCCDLFQHGILVVSTSTASLTLFWTLESDKELLPVRYVSNPCNDGLESDDRGTNTAR
jgi:hypothetical protein